MYQSLQASRAIAAILVVLFHLGGAIAAEKYFGIKGFSIPFSFGNLGVDFFFVLSGFIIYHVHKNDIGNPKKFFPYLYKRATRIYPAYLILFIGVYVLATITPGLRDTVPHDIGTLIKSILLFPQDKNVGGGTGSPVLIVAWTLQFEMLFYLAFSLGIVDKRLGWALIILFILLSLFSINTHNFKFPFDFLSSNYIWLFLMGMLSARLISLKELDLKSSFFLVIIGAIILLITTFDTITGYHQLEKINTILNGIGSSFLIIAMVFYEKKGKTFLGNEYFQMLGSSSYILYLSHFPLISILCKLSLFLGLQEIGVVGALVTYALILTLCVLSSVAFHLFIEKPIVETLRFSVKKSSKVV